MTLEAQARLLVLLAVEALGGAAHKQDVLNLLEREAIVRLDDALREQLPTRNEAVWRNKLAYTRQHLVSEGFLTRGQEGHWVITPEGRAELRRLFDLANEERAPQAWWTAKTLPYAATVLDADAPTADPAQLEARVARLLARAALPRPSGRANPRRVRVAAVEQIERDPRVKAWVLKAAAGVCECCRRPAPFATASGPYLEVHHVVQLAHGGPDTTENPIAVCPNCHRELHHGVASAQLRAALYAKIPRLRPLQGPDGRSVRN